MNEAYKGIRNKSKLSLYPLDFEQVMKDLLKVKPESKVKDTPEVMKREVTVK